MISIQLTSSGSDKDTTHSYGWLYDILIHECDLKIVLEIGVCEGASAISFLSFGCSYTGIDIDIYQGLQKLISSFGLHRFECTSSVVKCEDAPLCLVQTQTPDFSAFHLQQQDELKSLLPPKFDLIIDDGSHQTECQVAAIENLYQYLADDGVMVVEDIQSESQLDSVLAAARAVDPSARVHCLDLRHEKNRYDDLLVVIERGSIQSSGKGIQPYGLSLLQQIERSISSRIEYRRGDQQ